MTNTTTTDVPVPDEGGRSAAAAGPDPNRVAITINGREVAARKGEMVIAAADRAGEYIPHFCYHPRMSPVGMCRQCMVEVEGPRGPMMVVSCMTPVAEGQVVRTDTEQVVRAQEGMLELLLANHPLDCPVCDKGGECPLQDQAFSHGPGESRYVEEKRHYDKPIPISDLVYLDRERCILCDRCTRFADEVAGDRLIHFISRGNDTQVMTFPDEPFVSYFSGNTVQICPVGALTASPYRFKARPWDLSQTESTCTTCAVGCRVVVQSSRDELVRYQGVDSDPVNWGWLCDRGRFDFQAVGSEHRLASPAVRTADGLVDSSWSVALDHAAALIREAIAAGGAGSIALLGGARGTNEDAFAWAQLADAIGVAMRDPQLGDGVPPSLLDLPRATIDQACAASTVVLLAPDVKEELPVLALRLRDAAERRGARIVELAPIVTGMTPSAWRRFVHEPGHQPDAVAAMLGDDEVAEQLAAGPVVIVAGRSNLAESAEASMTALARLLDALPDATVLPALRRGNVVGALSVGLAPDPDQDALAALTAAAAGSVELLVLLGADPLDDVPDADLARRAIAGARRIIAVDAFATESSRRADVVLAASLSGEKDGTTTNLEGRVTAVAQKVTPPGTARPDWMIALDLAARLDAFGPGHPLDGVLRVSDVTDAVAGEIAGFGDATAHAVRTHPDGVLTTHAADEADGADGARESPAPFAATPRNSYDYRLVVSRTLYDRAVGTSMSPSLAGLAPGPGVHVHPLDLDAIGVAPGADVKLVGARATVVMPIRPHPKVPRGVVWSSFNQGAPAHQHGRIEDLIDATAPVTDLRIELV
jgi:NADH-quinone oxidoreductase subunit G